MFGANSALFLLFFSFWNRVLNGVTEDADIKRNEKKMSIRDMNSFFFSYSFEKHHRAPYNVDSSWMRRLPFSHLLAVKWNFSFVLCFQTYFNISADFSLPLRCSPVNCQHQLLLLFQLQKKSISNFIWSIFSVLLLNMLLLLSFRKSIE